VSIFVATEDRFKLQRLKKAFSERDRDGKRKITSHVPLSTVMPEEHRSITIVGENGARKVLTLDGNRNVFMPSLGACIVRVFPLETELGVNVHLTSGCITFCSSEPLLQQLKAEEPISNRNLSRV
jgi:hypothetical protein